jgi:type II secretory pathway pseudopilin PulG
LSNSYALVCRRRRADPPSTSMQFLWHSGRGVALVDLLAACALMAIVAAMAVPMLHGMRHRDETRMAARYLAIRFDMLRVQALRRNQVIAMRFDPDVLGQVGVYADGDRDGVLQRDIDDGVDARVDGEARLSDYFADVMIGIRADVPAPDDGAVLPAGSDPIRIGGTNLLSFSPLGTATSGTIYLVARTGPQMCVRILGATGRVRVMWYDQAGGAWRQD